MITVDNLRVRTSPNLDADKIGNLAINSMVVFLDKKSDTKIMVTIKGEEINIGTKLKHLLEILIGFMDVALKNKKMRFVLLALFFYFL